MTQYVILRDGRTTPVIVGGAGMQGPAGPAGASQINGLPIFIPAVTVGGSTDNAPAINAALADGDNAIVMLPAGDVTVESAILVPAGKTLRGAGRAQTTLLALGTFDRTVDGNAVVILEGIGAVVEDVNVDANKVGLGLGTGERINGVMALDGVTGYRVENVDIRNCSGYGRYDAGAEALTNPPGGFNISVRTFNCEVHFEPQGADGVYYIDCHARDGDADITQLDWFHPLVGSRNVYHIGCTGRGNVGAAVEVTANIADIDNINFTDCDFQNEGTGVALAVSGAVNDTTNLNIVNSRFNCVGGSCASINNAQGQWANSSFISGDGNAVVATGCDIRAGNCYFEANADPGGGGAAVTISAPSTQQIWLTGGKIVANGPPGLEVPTEGGVITNATILDPAGAGPSISVEENIQTEAGMKVGGSPVDGSNTVGGEIGYDGTNGLFFQAIDRTGGGAVDKGITFFSTVGFNLYHGPAYALSATFDATGLNLASGDVYKVNGTQVVGARGAAVADATDAPSAITQLNAALARLRAHGLIAT